MSELVAIGVNHRTAKLDLRERLAVDGPALAELLHEWRGTVREAVVLSTCNRVELYGVTSDPRRVYQEASRILEKRAGADVNQALYLHVAKNAALHTFRVASSLDSLAVGEPQVLGQLKQAFRFAQDEGCVGALTDRWMTRAFRAAKRVRSETDIAKGAVSVSSIGATLASKIFGKLAGRKALLIGAGEIGEAAAKSLYEGGAALTVVNRSEEKAQKLAQRFSGRGAGFDALFSELATADVVIATTASDRPILGVDQMKNVMRARRHKPLFLIDLAVPRDIDPRVGKFNNVFLYDVDDLEQIAEENLAQRRLAVEAAEKIIKQEVEDFEAWRRNLSLTPTIVGLRDHFHGVFESEVKRLSKAGAPSPEAEVLLKRLQHSVINKLLNTPLNVLKEDDSGNMVAAAQRLFPLAAAAENATATNCVSNSCPTSPCFDCPNVGRSGE